MRGFIFSFILFTVLLSNASAQVYPQFYSNNPLYVIEAVNSNILFAGGAWGELLKTTNGGSTWFNLNPGTTNAIGGISFLNEEVGWVCGREGMILKTITGGTNWNTQPTNVNNILHEIKFTSPDNGWAVGNDGIILHTNNGGQTWQVQQNGTGLILWYIEAVNDSVAWAAGISNYILKTTNGGDTWQQVLAPALGEIWAIDFVDENIGYAVGTDGAVVKSTNGGDSWFSLGLSHTTKFRTVKFLNELEGYIGGSNQILGTQDGGASWHEQYAYDELLDMEFPAKNLFWVVSISGIVFHSNQPVPVEFVTFTGSLIESEIQLSWSTATETNNRGFEIERNSTGEWEKVGFVSGAGTSTDIINYSYRDDVSSLSRDAVKYRLKQIDYDGSIQLSEIVEVKLGLPNSFELSQNYPNPFNPQTTISFSLSENSAIKLIVYNTIGEVVSVIKEGFFEAGYYNFIFDGSKISSGIYFCRLITEKSSQMIKMLLLK